MIEQSEQQQVVEVRPHHVSTVELITPEMSRTWLTEYRFPDQRSIREWHVQELAILMARDEFVPRPITFHFVEEAGYLTDGSHRMTAQARAEKSYLTTVERYYGYTMEDARRAYMAMDRGTRRTDADTIRASGIAHQLGMNDSEINRLASAAMMIYQQFTSAGNLEPSKKIEIRSSLLRKQLVEEWAPEAILYYRIVSNADGGLRRLMQQKSCMGVGLVILRYCPEKAEEFLSGAAWNDGLRQGEPEHSLIKVLTGQFSAAAGPINTVRAAVLARQVASCWNAKYEGRTVEMVRGHSPQNPIWIAGTPYTRRGLR